jgi:hypothetical protein
MLSIGSGVLGQISVIGRLNFRQRSHSRPVHATIILKWQGAPRNPVSRFSKKQLTWNEQFLMFGLTPFTPPTRPVIKACLPAGSRIGLH